MRSEFRWATALTALALFAAPFGSAQTAISVENPSFELPGDVKHNNWDTVPGWSSDTTATDSGVEELDTPPDGTWRGFLMNSDPAAWQLTGESIEAGATYTLTVQYNDGSGSTDLLAELYYDDGGTRVTGASQTFSIVAGTWTERTVTFVADDVAASVGNSLGILLDNTTAGDNNWAAIDNVRLSKSSGGGGGGVSGDPLFVDFSRTTTPVQSGYQGYLAIHEDPASFTAQGFSAFDTTVTVSPSWSADTDFTVMQLIDRAGDDGSEQPDLMRDWIGSDNRTLEGDLTLTISGLPAGSYNWLSYHHDPEDQTGPFDATITDSAGTQTVTAFDVSNGANFLTADTAQLTTTLVSDGGDIVMTFANMGAENGDSFFVMNAFEITAQDSGGGGEPVPQTEIVSSINPPFIDSGDLVVLKAPEGSSFQWSLDGTPITGATDRELVFSPIQASDAGSYTVTFNDGTGVVTPAAFIIEVNPEGTVPVSGLAGLIALMGACGIGGAGMLRRK